MTRYMFTKLQVDGYQHLPPQPRAKEKGEAALRGAAKGREAKKNSENHSSTFADF